MNTNIYIYETVCLHEWKISAYIILKLYFKSYLPVLSVEAVAEKLRSLDVDFIMDMDFLRFQRPVRTRGDLHRSQKLLKKLGSDIGEPETYAEKNGLQSLSISELQEYFTIFPTNTVEQLPLRGINPESQLQSKNSTSFLF